MDMGSWESISCKPNFIHYYTIFLATQRHFVVESAHSKSAFGNGSWTAVVPKNSLCLEVGKSKAISRTWFVKEVENRVTSKNKCNTVKFVTYFFKRSHMHVKTNFISTRDVRLCSWHIFFIKQTLLPYLILYTIKLLRRKVQIIIHKLVVLMHSHMSHSHHFISSSHVRHPC